MRRMPPGIVDLCYIDPPFFTQKDYKNIWGDKESVLDYKDISKVGFSDTKDFFERHINSGAKGLNAYLEWMRLRLAEIHRMLSPTGSFYCHLDYHAAHYIKIILDEIFGYEKFQSEIIWMRKKGTTAAQHGIKKFSINTDTILYYTKGRDFTFNPQYRDYSEEYLENHYRHKDEEGRTYKLGDISSPSYRRNLIYDYKGYKPPKNGWRYKRDTMQKLDKEGRLHFPKLKNGRIQRKYFADEAKGVPVTNLWDDIQNVQATSSDYTGWPTQKPIKLLERIISASSNEGDLIFDAFAGCGTAMHAAHRLKRKWIGMDISPTAIKVNKERLEKAKARVKIVVEQRDGTLKKVA